MIRTIKEAIRRSLTAEPATYWSGHLGAVLSLLRFTAARATGMAPFELATGRPALLPSVVLPPLPEEPSPEEEDQYYADVADRVTRLRTIASARMRHMERSVRTA